MNKEKVNNTKKSEIIRNNKVCGINNEIYKYKLWKERIIHLVINLVIFSSVFFISDTGSAMTILIILIPILVSINSLIYGYRVCSCDTLYSLLTALFFFPFIFIKMNENAWIYAIIYLCIAVILNVLGSFISNERGRSVKGEKIREVEEDIKEAAEEGEELVDDVVDFIDDGM